MVLPRHRSLSLRAARSTVSTGFQTFFLSLYVPPFVDRAQYTELLFADTKVLPILARRLIVVVCLIFHSRELKTACRIVRSLRQFCNRICLPSDFEGPLWWLGNWGPPCHHHFDSPSMKRPDSDQRPWEVSRIPSPPHHHISPYNHLKLPRQYWRRHCQFLAVAISGVLYSTPGSCSTSESRAVHRKLHLAGLLVLSLKFKINGSACWSFLTIELFSAR